MAKGGLGGRCSAFLRGTLLAGAAFSMSAPAQSGNLREALLGAYTTNPTLEAARAQQRGIDETVQIERSAGLPSLNASASENEFLKSSSDSPLSPARNLQAGVELGVPLYAGGAIKHSVRAAKKRVEAGRASLRGTEAMIFTQVVAAYMDVIRAESLVSLNANQVEVLTVNLQATTDRFEIGDLTRTDIAQSDARLALAVGDLRAAEANLIAARENYIMLVGAAPQALEPPPPLTGLPASAADALAYALQSNPDLIAAKESAKAAEHEIKVASSARLPKISLYSSGNYSDYLGSMGGAGNLVANSSTSANAGIRLSVPLFQGGRASALERQAQARSGAALDQVVKAERDVIAQTRTAFSSYRASEEIIKSSEQAVKAAELSLEGVRAENTIGNRTILEVLNAEQELLQARSQLIVARRNSYVAGFSLLAAMGKAEARDLGLEEAGPLYDPVSHYDDVDGKIWDWSREENPVSKATRTIDIPAPSAKEELGVWSKTK